MDIEVVQPSIVFALFLRNLILQYEIRLGWEVRSGEFKVLGGLSLTINGVGRCIV